MLYYNGGVVFLYYSRLRDLREDHDMVQKEIAAFLGIDQRVYSNYETGKREDTDAVCCVPCAAL